MMPGNRSSSYTVSDITPAVQQSCGGASEQRIKSRSGWCMQRRNFNERAAVAAGRLVAKDWPITKSWQLSSSHKVPTFHQHSLAAVAWPGQLLSLKQTSWHRDRLQPPAPLQPPQQLPPQQQPPPPPPPQRRRDGAIILAKPSALIPVLSACHRRRRAAFNVASAQCQAA